MKNSLSIELLTEEFKECLSTQISPIFLWQVDGGDLVFFDVCHQLILSFTPFHVNLKEVDLEQVKEVVSKILNNLERDGYLSLDRVSIPEEGDVVYSDQFYENWEEWEEWEECASDWTSNLQEFVFDDRN